MRAPSPPSAATEGFSPREAERRRLASFLHDELAQLLSAAALQPERVERARGPADEASAQGALPPEQELLLYRAAQLGGRLALEAGDGGGTALTIWLPEA